MHDFNGRYRWLQNMLLRSVTRVESKGDSYQFRARRHEHVHLELEAGLLRLLCKVGASTAPVPESKGGRATVSMTSRGGFPVKNPFSRASIYHVSTPEKPGPLHCDAFEWVECRKSDVSGNSRSTRPRVVKRVNEHENKDDIMQKVEFLLRSRCS